LFGTAVNQVAIFLIKCSQYSGSLRLALFAISVAKWHGHENVNKFLQISSSFFLNDKFVTVPPRSWRGGSTVELPRLRCEMAAPPGRVLKDSYARNKLVGIRIFIDRKRENDEAIK